MLVSGGLYAFDQINSIFVGFQLNHQYFQVTQRLDILQSSSLIWIYIFDVQAKPGELAHKKAKAATVPPAGSAIYASIFKSSKVQERETYACRSVGARFL